MGSSFFFVGPFFTQVPQTIQFSPERVAHVQTGVVPTVMRIILQHPQFGPLLGIPVCSAPQVYSSFVQQKIWAMGIAGS